MSRLVINSGDSTKAKPYVGPINIRHSVADCPKRAQFIDNLMAKLNESQDEPDQAKH